MTTNTKHSEHKMLNYDGDEKDSSINYGNKVIPRRRFPTRDDQKSLKCPDCVRVYYSRSGLRKHYSAIHVNEKKGNYIDSWFLNCCLHFVFSSPELLCPSCHVRFEHIFLKEIHQCPTLKRSTVKCYCGCQNTFCSPDAYWFHTFLRSLKVEIILFDN